MFWATVFINQRGCPTNLFGNLLTQLLSKNAKLAGATDEEAVTYGEEFRKVHGAIQEGFVAATNALSNEWISSPAGVEWLSGLDKARYLRVSI